MLSTYEQQLLQFRKDTGLTPAQLRGEDEIQPHEVANRPLSTYEQQLLEFAKEAGLTPAQLQGEDEIQKHEGANRPKYEPGKLFVWSRLLMYLPTRMYELHKWHMTAAASGMKFLEVRIEDHHYFHG